jgi:hypothetical protein
MARPTELTDLVSDAQKQWISSLQAARELTVRSLEVASGFAPKAPAPTAAIEGTFNLATQILALQKTYALAAVETFSGSAKPSNGAKSD